MDKEFLIYYFFYICIGFVLSIILIPFHNKISVESVGRYEDEGYQVFIFVLMFSFMWAVYLIIAPIVLIKNYSKSWKEFLNKEQL
jgi:uncharacterized membrane protein